MFNVSQNIALYSRILANFPGNEDWEASLRMTYLRTCKCYGMTETIGMERDPGYVDNCVRVGRVQARLPRSAA